MPRPALSEHYAVAPAGPGRCAELAFRSRDAHWPGFYPIGSVSHSVGMGQLPKLRLAAPMERLPDLT